MATKVKLIETGAVTGNIIPDGDVLYLEQISVDSNGLATRI